MIIKALLLLERKMFPFSFELLQILNHLRSFFLGNSTATLVLLDAYEAPTLPEVAVKVFNPVPYRLVSTVYVRIRYPSPSIPFRLRYWPLPESTGRSGLSRPRLVNLISSGTTIHSMVILYLLQKSGLNSDLNTVIALNRTT